MVPYPDVRQWTMRNKRSREERIYEQSELTIDGEAQLIALAVRTLKQLQAQGFDVERIGDLFGGDSGDQFDLALATEWIGEAITILPGAFAEAAAIMCSIFPVDELGKRNDKWTDEVSFLRASINTATVIEMGQTLVEQNDIERLRAPFEGAIRRFLTLGTGQPTMPPAPSGPRSTSSSGRATARSATSAGTSRGPSSDKP